jgi:hypothetical protein
MPTPAQTSAELMKQLIELTDAVKQLAQRPIEIEVDEVEREAITVTDRIRQRVSFSYQALGALTGRVSSASGREFDVPVVAALRRRGVIGLDRLPPNAAWAELRAGDRLEVLRILRGDGDDTDPFPTPAPIPAGADGLRRRHSDRGVVRPKVFADSDPIGSIVVLRDRLGPLLAFGPRLAALEAGID